MVRIVFSFVLYAWHWQRGPVSSIDAPSCVEADEIVAPLVVPSGTRDNGADSAGRHTIIVLLMSLDICSKFHATMRVEIDLTVEDQFARALCT